MALEFISYSVLLAGGSVLLALAVLGMIAGRTTSGRPARSWRAAAGICAAAIVATLALFGLWVLALLVAVATAVASLPARPAWPRARRAASWWDRPRAAGGRPGPALAPVRLAAPQQLVKGGVL